MTTPTSLRLAPALKARLAQAAAREGIGVATLAQRFIDEGLRATVHPGITFRGGPAGRRPGLVAGPDVAEVIDVIRHLDERGNAAVAEAARWLEISTAMVGVAVGYYADFSDEIDAELARRAAAAHESKERYDRQRQLLA